MTYENAVEKIHSLLTFGSRPGLDRMRILLDRLGNPQDRLKFIHIAGTNGKGSVCAMLHPHLLRQATKQVCSFHRISRIFVRGYK